MRVGTVPDRTKDHFPSMKCLLLFCNKQNKTIKIN